MLGLAGDIARPMRPRSTSGKPDCDLIQVFPPSVERCTPEPGPPALSVVLAGADPDDGRILRIDRDRADRERALTVEDRREGRAAVRCLPHPARGGADVPGLLVRRIDGDVGDAARGQRGTDRAKLE